MTSAPRRSAHERWNRFIQWFFNSSPTALIEPPEPIPEPKSRRQAEALRTNAARPQGRVGQIFNRATARH